MDAGSKRPKKKATSKSRHIPAEIVEEILLNLPVKSVLRFSSVSKSWRSMISEPRFIQRYGAVSGRERIVISPFSPCPPSAILIQDATEIVSPFMETPNLVASCDELWCVEVGASLFLWNPSMNTYKKLADPPSSSSGNSRNYYGLGYDCGSDDYKVLKISVGSTELYSLRQDSWRNIELFPCRDIGRPGVLVNGALHWLDCSRSIIVYFELTREVYGGIAPPPHLLAADKRYYGVIASRRKLYFFDNYKITNFAVVWVMHDKSWIKLFQIQYTNHFPPTDYFYSTLRLFHHYDNGDILIEIMSRDGNWNMFIYNKGDGDAMPTKIVGSSTTTKVSLSYVYAGDQFCRKFASADHVIKFSGRFEKFLMV